VRRHGAAVLQRRCEWLIAADLFLAGLAVYGYAIHLPFRIDDFIQLRWVHSRSMAEIWASASGLAYYRPVTFTMWKLGYLLTGSYPAPLFHAVNVVCHALNGVLVFALVRFQQGRARIGTLAGAVMALLFVLFPFSYQAVPWVGALVHPLVVCLSLCAIILAVLASERGAPSLHAVALALAFLTPFTHEAGVLVAPLLTLFYLTAAPGVGLRKALSRVWPYWLCSLAAAALVLVLRGDVGTPGTTAESWLQNGIYFLQGLLYPVAPLATRLRVWLPGLSDLAAVLIVCVPVLLFLVWLYARLGQIRLLAFGLGWYAITIAPAWLLLGFSYVVDGPRLMYESALGAAVLWGIPAVLLLGSRPAVGRRRLACAGAAGLVVLGTLAGSLSFLAERRDMYEQTRQAAQGLLAEATAPGAALSVNFPGWLAPRSPTYALGHEGVSFIPDYSSPMDLLWTMTGSDRFVDSVVVTELQSHWRFDYRNYGREVRLPDLQPHLRDMADIYYTSYRGNDLVTLNAGGLERQGAAPAQPYVAAYDGRVALLGGEWARAGDTLRVTLRWQSWVTLTQAVHTYVHLQNEAGELVAQEDGLPVMGLADPLWWKPGDQWRDTRVLALPPGIRPGHYTLRVGVYPAAGGPRYVALGANGRRYQNDSADLGVLALP
jgi:hypothetical protein